MKGRRISSRFFSLDRFFSSFQKFVFSFKFNQSQLKVSFSRLVLHSLRIRSLSQVLVLELFSSLVLELFSLVLELDQSEEKDKVVETLAVFFDTQVVESLKKSLLSLSHFFFFFPLFSSFFLPPPSLSSFSSLFFSSSLSHLERTSLHLELLLTLTVNVVRLSFVLKISSLSFFFFLSLSFSFFLRSFSFFLSLSLSLPILKDGDVRTWPELRTCPSRWWEGNSVCLCPSPAGIRRMMVLMIVLMKVLMVLMKVLMMVLMICYVTVWMKMVRTKSTTLTARFMATMIRMMMEWTMRRREDTFWY